MSSSNRCFLTCIQISQEADQVVWYSHVFQKFPQFIMIHTVNCGKFWKRWEYQTTWSASCETCTQVRRQQLELNMEEQTGSTLGMEYDQLYIVTLLINVYTESVQFSHSVMSNSLRPHGLQHARLPFPSPIPGATQTHVRWVGDAIQPSNPLSSPSPPAPNLSWHQDLFQWVSSLIRWPKYWSFSFNTVFPMNTQDWSPLGSTGWISLQSRGLPRVFSNTTVQKHQFFGASFLYSPTLTSIHDHWKNHSVD